MARTEITLTELSPYSGSNQDATFTLGDVANGMKFKNDGGVFLYLANEDASNTMGVTVLGIASDRTFGIARDHAFTLGSGLGTYAITGFYPVNAFSQTDGYVDVDFSGASSAFRIAAIRVADLRE